MNRVPTLDLYLLQAQYASLWRETLALHECIEATHNLLENWMPGSQAANVLRHRYGETAKQVYYERRQSDHALAQPNLFRPLMGPKSGRTGGEKIQQILHAQPQLRNMPSIAVQLQLHTQSPEFEQMKEIVRQNKQRIIGKLVPRQAPLKQCVPPFLLNLEESTDRPLFRHGATVCAETL